MAFSIGENIKKLRTEKGVTQEQLAGYLSITYQSVSKWENNVTTPDLFLIPAIAEYFEVQIDELFKPNMRGYKNKAERFLYLYGAHSTKENFDKADAEYEKLFKEDNGDGKDFFNYGHLNECQSYTLAKKAEKFYKQAIEVGFEKAEYQLNYLLASTSRKQENIDKYEKALKNEPEIVRNWYLLALSYSRSEATFEESLKIAKEGLRKFPDNKLLLNLSAMVCRAVGKYDEAKEFCEKAIAVAPDMIDNYYELAFIYTDMKNYVKAIDSWAQVIAVYEIQGINAEDIEIGTLWPKQEIEKLKTLIDNS